MLTNADEMSESGAENDEADDDSDGDMDMYH